MSIVMYYASHYVRVLEMYALINLEYFFNLKQRKQKLIWFKHILFVFDITFLFL